MEGINAANVVKGESKQILGLFHSMLTYRNKKNPDYVVSYFISF